MPAEVSLEEATVTLAGRTVLQCVSLEVRAGECVALIGANGAGKTTALRASLGLLPLAKGRAVVSGQDAHGLAPLSRARLAAYLPQARPLAWGISVQALVELGRFAKGQSPQAVSHALELCGLTALANRRADSLSGGELARAHLARALAAETPILVTDEPTAALDPRHAFLVMQLLAAQAKAGAAVIAALHDLSLAARFATRIVVLKEGAVIADGPPAEALSAATLRAAFGIEAQTTKVDEAYALLVKGPS